MSEDWNEVICVDEWSPDEAAGYEKGYYPEGARDKAIYTSPDDVGVLPLKPSWRYLLKKSREWAPWQFWMEVMGYRIGQAMGVDVPPAYVGLRRAEDNGEDTYGALIEWFYSAEERYISGAQMIEPHIESYDREKGKQHNLATNLGVVRSGEEPDEVMPYVLNYWAKVLTFDTVIGNVDRHPVNWGLVLGFSEGQPDRFRLSPAFDNGTAMAWGEPVEKLHLFDNDEHVIRYLKKGKHQMRWDLGEVDTPRKTNFFEFMARLVSEYPETRNVVEGLLTFTEEDLRLRLQPLVSITTDANSCLTQQRLDFTLRLVMKRTELLREALEKP